MIRTCVIIQPTYLPWMGLFDLVDQADEFVFLDTVQFCPRSWDQRNRIRQGDVSIWLTVPVKHAHRQMINDVEIVNDENFLGKHLRAMRQEYGTRAKYFEAYWPHIVNLIRRGASNLRLSDMNICITSGLCEILGLYRFATQLGYRRSSQLRVEGSRSERLVNICQALGCSRYLSPIGSKDYLLEDRAVFDVAGIEVVLQNYEHPRYNQGLEFMSHLSVIDLIFHEGHNALGIIRSGRREAFPLEAR